MKIRHGFVSNSSSTAFIVIGYDPYITAKGDYSKRNRVHCASREYVLGAQGATEFGWDPIRYSDFDSKANFAYLQAHYLEDESLKARLLQVIEAHSGVPVRVEMPETAYIDHQSAAIEGMNLEMFESDDTLARFLFSDNSYIQGGNDNG